MTGANRLVLIIFAVMGLFSCAKSPDLVPITRSGGQKGMEGIGPSAFCEQDKDGRLVVTIQNQGTADAPDSTVTRVEFGNSETFTQYTPAIPAGANVGVSFEIPGSCFDSDCNFLIIVDAENLINEANEGNNKVDGICSQEVEPEHEGD